MATTTRKIPAPLYAAAGAGDLAYQQLRKLPEQVAQLRGRVAELRPAVTEAVAETNLDKIREAARRNANAFVAGAQEAQVRATAVYKDLVARGHKVVGDVEPAAIEVAPAKGTVSTATGPDADKVAKKAPAKKATATR